MALKRPALDILGISLSSARRHHQTVVVAFADAIYRTAMSRYHPDKGDEAIPLPTGVDLTELQAARDAVRENPSACIKEIGQSQRTSEEEKLAGELAARVSVLEETNDAQTENARVLWDLIARQRLSLNSKEDVVDNKVVAYSLLHLNGMAILAAAGELGKGGFCEYLCHNGTWDKRPVVK